MRRESWPFKPPPKLPKIYSQKKLQIATAESSKDEDGVLKKKIAIIIADAGGLELDIPEQQKLLTLVDIMKSEPATLNTTESQY